MMWRKSGRSQDWVFGTAVLSSFFGALQGSAYGDKPRSDVCSPVIYRWTSVGDTMHMPAHGIPRNILESVSLL